MPFGWRGDSSGHCGVTASKQEFACRATVPGRKRVYAAARSRCTEPVRNPETARRAASSASPGRHQRRRPRVSQISAVSGVDPRGELREQPDSFAGSVSKLARSPVSR